MSDSAVAVDLNQTLDVHCGFAAKFALNGIVVLDLVTELRDLFLCKILSTLVGIDTGLCENVLGAFQSDTVNLGKSDLYALLIRDINT